MYVTMAFGPSTTIRFTRLDPVQRMAYRNFAIVNLTTVPRHL